MFKTKNKNLTWTDVNMGVVQLEKLILHFAQCNKADGKSPRTISWYSYLLGEFCKFLNLKGLARVLSTFNVVTVRDYIVHEQERGLSPFSVQGKVRALKAFSSWLFREGYLSSNVLALVKIPKAPNKMVKPLTDAEIDCLMGMQNPMTALGCRNIALLITLLATGLRESEISDLRFENSNIEAGYLKVMGKGAKERVVPTGALCQKILWRYVFHFRPEPENDLNNFLFLTLDGKKLRPNAIRLFLKRWGRKAGVARLHAHLCRHTYATNFLIRECGDVFRLQQILGHTTLEMVRKYVHFASTEAMIQGHVTSPVDKLELKQLRGYKIDKLIKSRKL